MISWQRISSNADVAGSTCFATVNCRALTISCSLCTLIGTPLLCFTAVIADLTMLQAVALGSSGPWWRGSSLPRPLGLKAHRIWGAVHERENNPHRAAAGRLFRRGLSEGARARSARPAPDPRRPVPHAVPAGAAASLPVAVVHDVRVHAGAATPGPTAPWHRADGG